MDEVPVYHSSTRRRKEIAQKISACASQGLADREMDFLRLAVCQSHTTKCPGHAKPSAAISAIVRENWSGAG